MNTNITMTPELNALGEKLEYLIKRRQTSILGNEIGFYNTEIRKVQDEIEKLVLAQIEVDTTELTTEYRMEGISNEG